MRSGPRVWRPDRPDILGPPLHQVDVDFNIHRH